VLLQACLNGSRTTLEHSGVPIDPATIARDAARVRRAGAGGVHVHPRASHGAQSLDPSHVAAVITAIREACPGLPIGVTTAAWIEPDVERRLALIATWTLLPDYASVNLGEEGALEVIDLLAERGVGVEAGVRDERDALFLIDSGLDAACSRVLVETEAIADPLAAVRLAGAIDAALDNGLVETPRLHHGGGIATWAVIGTAIERGHDVRVGLEDTLVHRDGRVAADNEELVFAAAELGRAGGRMLERSPH